MLSRNTLLTKFILRSFYAIALLMVSSGYLKSQIDFSGGIEAGAATSQVSGDALSGYDKFGLSAGPFIRATFSDKHSARLSILYINKGSRKNANPDKGDFRTYVLKLNYLEVPILYNYTYDSFKVEGGLGIGTLVKNIVVEDGIERNLIEPFENLEFSVLAGLSYTFSENLFVTGRFAQSIIPVRKAPNVVNALSFYEAGQYNSVIQLMLGYEF